VRYSFEDLLVERSHRNRKFDGESQPLTVSDAVTERRRQFLTRTHRVADESDGLYTDIQKFPLTLTDTPRILKHIIISMRDVTIMYISFKIIPPLVIRVNGQRGNRICAKADSDSWT
jgi:hypothetical protein